MGFDIECNRELFGFLVRSGTCWFNDLIVYFGCGVRGKGGRRKIGIEVLVVI